MPVPPRVPGGASQLARDWWADVNIGSYASPNWIPISGVQELKPSLNPSKQDSTDFDSGGYKDEEITALQWGLDLKLGRKALASDGTAYDPGVEVLRLAALQLGAGNRVDIRFYEMGGGSAGLGSNPRVEAYRGYVNVTWSPDGGNGEALSTISVTLGGKGKRTAITHPDDGTPSAPVIQSLSPTTAATAGGTLITATGTNFASVTAVSVGGTSVSASDYSIIGGSKIVFKAPAKTAGAQNVIITNPGGSSAAVALTYA